MFTLVMSKGHKTINQYFQLFRYSSCLSLARAANLTLCYFAAFHLQYTSYCESLASTTSFVRKTTFERHNNIRQWINKKGEKRGGVTCIHYDDEPNLLSN